MRGSEKPKSKGIRSMRIQSASNGFTTHSEHETDGGYLPDEVAVHPDVDSVVNHIKNTFGNKKLTKKQKGAD